MSEQLPSNPTVGQRWRELDPRPEYERLVEVVAVEGDRIQIMRVGGGVRRWAQLKRFNGQRGGYALETT